MNAKVSRKLQRRFSTSSAIGEVHRTRNTPQPDRPRVALGKAARGGHRVSHPHAQSAAGRPRPSLQCACDRVSRRGCSGARGRAAVVARWRPPPITNRQVSSPGRTVSSGEGPEAATCVCSTSSSNADARRLPRSLNGPIHLTSAAISEWLNLEHSNIGEGRVRLTASTRETLPASETSEHRSVTFPPGAPRDRSVRVGARLVGGPPSRHPPAHDSQIMEAASMEQLRGGPGAAIGVAHQHQRAICG